MDNPELYRIANEMQRYDVACAITEYGSKMKWLSEGGDSLIDLGSGSGDVLMDFIYPRMPQNLQRFVCSDVNATMVEYARKQFGHLKGTQFRIFDMATSTENLPSDLMGQFDHVTSFFALMYSPNQRYISSL